MIVKMDVETEYDKGNIVAYKNEYRKPYIGIIIDAKASLDKCDNHPVIKYTVVVYANNEAFTDDVFESEIYASINQEDFACIQANYDNYKDTWGVNNYEC